MSGTVERTFVVAHSAVVNYRTKVTMGVPSDIADDPDAIRMWLEQSDAYSGDYQWSDAFNPATDQTNVTASEIDGVDFDI